MTISVLMSFYNALPFLRECLDSLLAQEEQDWELVAVNNFSTDESAAMVEAYARRDKRIRLFHNTEEGIIQALRLALAKSQGQLITRMDADDIMPPQKLRRLRETLEQQGPGYLATGLVHYFSHEGPVGRGFLRYAEWLNELTRVSANFTQVYKECVIPSPCWMCFREDLQRCGAFEPHRYPEDYDLCFRFYAGQLRVVGIPEVLHEWRDYPSRTSRNDERYANQLYFDLKVPWFLELDRDPTRPLVLWGTGNKGKPLAKKLLSEGISFHWITNNPNKQGLHIYGALVSKESLLEQLPTAQVLMAVSQQGALPRMERRLQAAGRKLGQDYFYFL